MDLVATVVVLVGKEDLEKEDSVKEASEKEALEVFSLRVINLVVEVAEVATNHPPQVRQIDSFQSSLIYKTGKA